MDLIVVFGGAYSNDPNQVDWRAEERLESMAIPDTSLEESFRLTRPLITKLIEKIGHVFQHPDGRNNPIPVQTCILSSLRLLASGSFQGVSGDTLQISQSSMSRILPKFCNAVITHLKKDYMSWYNPEELHKTKYSFYKTSGISGVIGLIDGTQIPMKGAVGPAEPAFICRKGFPSINVQVVTGASGEFRSVFANFPGSTHDSFVWNNSRLRDYLTNHPEEGFLIGDQGYALEEILITVIANPTTDNEKRFNMALRRLRSAVERAIGMWKMTWRCLHKSGGALQYSPEKTCQIIRCCAILQNFRLKQSETGLEQEEEVEDGDDDSATNQDERPLTTPNAARLAILKRQQVVATFVQNNPVRNVPINVPLN